MAILDTNILVSLLKGDSDAKSKINSLRSSGTDILTTTITAYELLKGAAISSRSTENLERVWDLLSTIDALELSHEACEEASKIYSELRAKGTMIGEFDILIAAIAKSTSDDQSLVTRDEHFKKIKGLKMERW
jgi:tRNA(fMet)-specific endonuclease VapC